MTIMMIVGRKACVYWSATAAVKDGCHAHVDCHFDRGIARRGAAAVGRFVHLYCSLGWDDSYTSCGGVRQRVSL